MGKSIRLMAALAASALVLAGCAGGGGEKSTDGPESGVESGATSGDEKYAVVLKVLSSEFWQKMEAGVQEKADELGVTVDIYAANTEDDVEGQVAVAENLLGKGYLGLGLAPLTGDNLISVVARATSEGIPVVNIDEGFNSEALEAADGASIGFVTTDNVQVGEMGAGYVIERLGDEGGQVAVVEGRAGTASGEARKEGATAAFNAASNIDLVDSQPADWDRTKAFDLATNFISKYPDLKGIYCANDTMAMGVQQAVMESGKDIIVVGTDGNADAVESVEAGELDATVAQDSGQIGSAALEMLVNFVRSGEKFDSSVVGEEILIAPILITKD